MHKARNVALALSALVVLALGVRSLVRRPDTGNGRLDRAEAAGRASLPPNTTISIAKFADAGAPDNCADVTFLVGKELDYDKLRARSFAVLKSTCKEAFPSLPVLATCTRSNEEDDAGPSARAVGYYYDLATIAGDDTYRGQCLGTGGSWGADRLDEPRNAALRARLVGVTAHHEIDSLMELMP